MANQLTIARIALIAPFVAAFLWDAPWNAAAALAIFLIASATDFLDGYVARARGETTAHGAALDPIADKLLIAAALILLVRNGVVREGSVVAALLIILREILVSGLREALAGRGVDLPVTALAKWKTTAQILAVAALLAAAPNGALGPSAHPVATGLLWFAAALTAWTGAQYALGAGRRLRGV